MSSFTIRSMLAVLVIGCGSAPPATGNSPLARPPTPAARLMAVDPDRPPENRPSAAALLVGPWHGAVTARATAIGIDVRFTAGGELSGTWDVPEQAIRGLSVSNVRFDGERLWFDSVLPGDAPVQFRGKLVGDEITGDYTQAGHTTHFALSKGEPVKPSHEVSTADYDEHALNFSSGDHTIAGTLTVPHGVAHPPVAVLISGSGPNARDEKVFGFAVFAELAHALAKGGVASLRYDKRGIGESTGDYRTATTVDFVVDVEAALRALRARTDIDAKNIGLIGHSEGGMIAPMVAAKDPRLAFVVLLAGPAQPIEALMVAQIERSARAEGAPEAFIAKNTAVSKRAFELLRTGQDLSVLGDQLVDEDCKVDCENQKNAALDKLRKQFDSPWFRYFIAYDPAPTLRAVRVPTLALYGALDVQVPADLNLPALRSAMSRMPKGKLVAETLDGVNHLFQAAHTGAVSEYAKLDKSFDPRLVPKILEFVTHR